MRDLQQELLAIFNDPLLADVKLPPVKATADDRWAATLENVTAWVEAHGHEPQMSGELSERMMANQLKALRTRASRELLAGKDRLGLLNDNQL